MANLSTSTFTLKVVVIALVLTKYTAAPCCAYLQDMNLHSSIIAEQIKENTHSNVLQRNELVPLFTVDRYVQDMLQQGKQHLEVLSFQNATPDIVEACQHDADLHTLHQLCQIHNEDTFDRIAIVLANCHLAKSELPHYRCPADRDVGECRIIMGKDARAFDTWTSFRQRADQVCMFIEQRTRDHVIQQSVVDLLEATLNTADVLNSFGSSFKNLSEDVRITLSSAFTQLRTTLASIDDEAQNRFHALLNSTSLIVLKQDAAFDAIDSMLSEAADVHEQLVEHTRNTVEITSATQRQQQELHSELLQTTEFIQSFREEHNMLILESTQNLQDILELSHRVDHAQKEAANEIFHHLQEQKSAFSMNSELISELSYSHQQAVEDTSSLLQIIAADQKHLRSIANRIHDSVEQSATELELLRLSQREAFAETVQYIEQLRIKSEQAHLQLTSFFEDIREGLNKITHFDASILLHFFQASTMIFYTCTMGFIWFMTSNQTTSRARLPLLSANVIAWFIENRSSSHLYYEVCFWIRYSLVLSTAAFLLLGWTTYKDYAQLSYVVMVSQHELLQHNNEMLRSLTEGSATYAPQKQSSNQRRISEFWNIKLSQVRRR